MKVLHTIQHLKLTYVKDAELKKKKEGMWKSSNRWDLNLT